MSGKTFCTRFAIGIMYSINFEHLIPNNNFSKRLTNIIIGLIPQAFSIPQASQKISQPPVLSSLYRCSVMIKPL